MTHPECLYLLDTLSVVISKSPAVVVAVFVVVGFVVLLLLLFHVEMMVPTIETILHFFEILPMIHSQRNDDDCYCCCNSLSP
jgi:hypothetical protein